MNVRGYDIMKGSAATPLLFQMVAAADHTTPVLALAPMTVISKNGGAFAAAMGPVTEVGNGWYQIAGDMRDTNTLGPLVLYATGITADPTSVTYQVVGSDPNRSWLADLWRPVYGIPL